MTEIWKAGEQMKALGEQLKAGGIELSPGETPRKFYAKRGIARAQFAFTESEDKESALATDVQAVTTEIERIEKVESDFAERMKGPFFFARDFREHHKGDPAPAGHSPGQILTMLNSGILVKQIDAAPSDKMVRRGANKSRELSA